MSAMTVARVLKGDRAYARPSAERRALQIQKIAERLHYRPNQAAKAVRTGRFGVIALVIPAQTEGGFLPTELLDGILAETEARDVHLAIARIPEAGARPPRLWRERAVDGLLLVGDLQGLPEVQKLPAIVLGVQRDRDCVHPDEVAAGRQATELLRHLGHRAIVFIGMANSPQVCLRQAGYIEALAGLSPLVVEPPFAEQVAERIQWARRLLSTPARPTAIVCGATGDAVPVLLAAAELGIAVPHALSIIAIDTVAMHAHLGFTPTRIVVPFQMVGRVGVAQLVEKIAHPTIGLQPASIAFELRDGGTCAPPP